MKLQKEPNDKSNLFSPFKVLKIEKAYWYWLSLIPIISTLSFLIALLSFDLDSININFSQGYFYTVCLALLVPYLFDFFIDIIVAKKNKKDARFVSYKSHSAIISLLLIIIIVVFMISSVSSTLNNVAQIVIFIFTLIFTFYMFLTSKMSSNHYDYFKKYDNSCYEYLQEENNVINGIIEKVESLERIKNDQGDDIIL